MQNKNEKLEQRVFKLKDQFDIEEPEIGHFNRFESKLKGRVASDHKTNVNIWKWIAIAASIALIFSVGFHNFDKTSNGLELADVSPKMEETQSFFVSTIKQELKQIDLKRNEDNKQIIDDTFTQLEKLEKNYNKLTLELKRSNKDRRIVYAMIANFQQRIEVLQFLIQQLNELEQLKNIKNENTII
ncbi:hypothetical protein EGM88_06240 [Aureibaculum marinum]|uniref:DUF4179 domain-containing protein n=1 Tax=Aureibaculum marinum TaxID=2487930 RepID=A0A3N4P1B8_9FLAO|nr:hypothetical protein [Aureibaculum marinum]RPD98786.1 hypothetical protein EGM88_06240 [Aureibaculum marinum]